MLMLDAFLQKQRLCFLVETKVVTDYRMKRNATNTTQRAIVKLPTGNTEALLQREKDINKKSNVFVSYSFCPY